MSENFLSHKIFFWAFFENFWNQKKIEIKKKNF